MADQSPSRSGFGEAVGRRHSALPRHCLVPLPTGSGESAEGVSYRDRSRFPKTHDLTVLLGLAASKTAEFAALADAAIVLTPYATLFRYPDAAMEPDDEDVREALALAGQVLAVIERHLGITS